MADVARLAGVSTATVSRVLNGGRVAPHTQRKVERAIAILGYRPNTLARSLVTGRSGVIGVVIPDVAGTLYSQMARGIEDVLLQNEMNFMMMTGNREPEHERAALELLLEKRVDGLILIGSGLQHDPLASLIGEGLPVVLMEREGPEERYPTIFLDNRAGAVAATRYLLSQGHRRIAHVAGIRRAGQLRLDGFLSTLREAGVEPGPIVQGDFSEASGWRAGERLLQEEGVTAVFCANDRMALGFYGLLSSRQIRVPEQISVVGFDDLPWGAYVSPPLTTVRQPAREMGRVAAQLMVRILAGEEVPPRTAISPELVVRSSVRCLEAPEPGASGRG